MPPLKSSLAVLLACIASTVMHAQALPVETTSGPYTGFSLPTIGGSLRYSLTASETILTGYNGTAGQGASTYTNFSGNLAYLSRSEHHPFSAVYSGGYLVGNSEFPSYGYQGLSLSQVLETRNWNFVVADSVNYSPQTPVTGLSGIPGAGDVNVTPVQVSPETGLGILTIYASRVTNTVSGTATRNLTGSTAISGTGSYLLQRYTGDSSLGIDNDGETAAATLRHRLDGRTSIGGSYAFTNSSFRYRALGSVNEIYQTHSVVGTFTRQLSHTVSLNLTGGPQWIVPGGGGLLTQSSVSAIVNASLNYTGKEYNLGLSYSRSINNGNGVVVGSQNDTVSFSAVRQFDRIFQVSGLVGYNRSTQLAHSVLADYNSSGVVAGAQVSVQVSRPVSVFAGYTLQRQLFDGVSPTGIAFNGLTNYISFGVTYAPKAFFDRK